MMKKLNKKIVALLVAVIVILLFIILFLSMRIQTIEIEGNEQYNDEEIQQIIFDKDYDKNMLVFWIKNKLGQNETIPFVEKYDVEIESFSKVKIVIYEKSIVGYIDYMGTYMYFDKDGMVVESSNKLIDGIPKITGIDFEYILLHEPLPVEDKKVFDLILSVTQTLHKYKIEVKRLYISNSMEITLYIGDVKVYLGKEKDLNEKISDLSDMVSKLEGYSGTLDMSVLDTEGNGYTLKRD